MLEKVGKTSRKSALKRLAQTLGKIEKSAGIGMSADLRFPTPLTPLAVDQGQTAGIDLGAHLDVLVAGSRLGETGDGRIYFGGVAATTAKLAIKLVSTGVTDTALVFPFAGSPPRFVGTFSNGGEGLPEGNYVVATDEGGTAHPDAAGIGVR